MAEWIRRRIKLRRFMGLVKDQVAVGRAVAHSRSSELHLAVVRATSHEEVTPDETCVKSVLAVGSSSRMRVSYCIRVIMNRLNKTQNWAVALKCLILIHRILHEGGFMFQDQLSFYPARGGRNSLNLSKFKDTGTPFTWAVSSWIRWYAKFLEQWILTSRGLGTFLDSRTSHSKAITEKLSCLATGELVREIIALQDLLQETCGWQAEESVIQNVLVREALRLVILDSLKAHEELKVRMREVPERITTLQRSEAFQLLQVCEKLSLQSMKLTHLMEVGQDLNVLQTLESPGKILFTDYELMKMKEALRLASIQNMSASSVRSNSQNGLSFQPRRLSTWKRSGFFGRRVESGFALEEGGRRRAMSHLILPKTLL